MPTGLNDPIKRKIGTAESSADAHDPPTVESGKRPPSTGKVLIGPVHDGRSIVGDRAKRVFSFPNLTFFDFVFLHVQACD